MAKDKGDKGEEVKYRIHDMAAAFPLPTPEEYAAIKDNVEQFGFIYPKVFWKDTKDSVWLIDGRTRDRIETEFQKAGKEEAKNGNPLTCPVAFFQGTESEAVNYVRGLNLSRRALTSGQKAAAAIISGDLFRRYKAKEDGKDLVEDEVEDIGDLATRVAKEAGTNRAYVFDCAKLNREHPDLLQRVLMPNGLSIPNAKKIAKRRADGLPDEPPEGGEEPIEVAPEDGPEIVYDGLKNEVAPELHAIFKFRAVVKAAKKAIRGAMEDVEEGSEQPGGKNVSFQTVKADANNVVRHLEDHQPHAPCPYCSGTGKAGDPENPGKKCGHCKGKKFMDRLQWKEVPAELRALFDKKAGSDKDDDEQPSGGERYGT